MSHHFRHPQSIDALCAIPSRYSNAQSTILTGSSDGLLRAVQLFPTKLLGVVADHGEFPIERIAVDRKGEGRWVGSAGHEEILKLTDLEEVFGDDDEEEEGNEEGVKSKEKNGGEDSEEDESDGEEDSSSEGEDGPGIPPVSPRKKPEPEAEASEPAVATRTEADADSSDDEGVVERKRKRKKEKEPLQAAKRSKGRNEVVAEPSFFADL